VRNRHQQDKPGTLEAIFIKDLRNRDD